MWIVFELLFLNFLLELQIIFYDSNFAFQFLFSYFCDNICDILLKTKAVFIVFKLFFFYFYMKPHLFPDPNKLRWWYPSLMLIHSRWYLQRIWMFVSLWTGLRTCLDQFMDQFRPVKTSFKINILFRIHFLADLILWTTY